MVRGRFIAWFVTALFAGMLAASGLPACSGGGGGGDDQDGSGGNGSDAGGSAAQLCTNTGGTIITVECCESAGYLPDTCLPGVCGCQPTGYMAQVCACPDSGSEPSCFDHAVGCKPFKLK